MAWISVHEQVIGGKLRSLSKEIGCSQNEALGLLVRLWLWGINNADKEGRIIGAVKGDVAEVLTIGIDSRYSPDKVVDALVSTSWIDIDGDLYIHDWEEWQEQWYKAIEVRERDAARKREERKKARAAKMKNNVAVPEFPKEAPDVTVENGMEANLPTPKLIIPHDEDPKSQPAATTYSNGFEEFWSIYPRKVGKGEAYKKYKARLNDGWSPDELKAAAEAYASICARKKTEKDYIKHAKTFLSENTPFADYLPKKEDAEPVAGNSNDDDPYADWR